MKPENSFPSKSLDSPATGEADNVFPGHGEVALSGKSDLEHTAGQPDTWPQRPDVNVPKTKTAGLIPAPLE